jgi:hypothetical protein
MLRLWIVVLFCVLAQALATAETAKFSGRVLQGQDFGRRLSSGLWFCLQYEPGANENGWVIGIQESCAEGAHNFATIVTPPLHGPNDTDVQSWEFAPTTNASKFVRRFSFVLSDEDWQRAINTLNDSYAPAANTSKEVDARCGHGTLTITRMRHHESPDGGLLLDTLDFRVTLTWPGN